MKKQVIFVVAAGSGGHILPALTCGQHWLKDNPTGEIFLFTGTSDLEKKIARNHSYLERVFHAEPTRFSLKHWWQIPLLLIQFIMLFFRSFYYALKYRPEKVISTGGLIAIPICIAARLARCPVELYELNVVPGKAIHVLIPIATTIHTVFPQTKSYCCWGKIDFSAKCRESAYPLRFDQQDKIIDKASVLKRINFNSSRKTLFILGGSQGSLFLNNQIKNVLTAMPELASKIQVIHQIGAFDDASWDTWYKEHHIPALTFSYDEKIHEYYALADLIMCRAGAGTLFEIAFFNKKCIVIPLVASTTDHQIYNARAMAEIHPELFTVLEQEDVRKSPELLVNTIKKML